MNIGRFQRQNIFFGFSIPWLTKILIILKLTMYWNCLPCPPALSINVADGLMGIMNGGIGDIIGLWQYYNDIHGPHHSDNI